MTTARDRWAETIGRARDLSLVVLSLVLIAAIVTSGRWRLNGDAAVMLYAAALQSDWGRVVYRDVFDMNAPGAHLAFRAVYGLTDGADAAIRVLDITCLLALMGLTSLIVRRWGRRAMWSGAVLVGLMYVGAGDALSLQREFLLLIPTALALAIVSSRSGLVPGRLERVGRAFVAGVCVGVASTIKPQAAAFVVVVVVALTGGPPGRRRVADATVTLVAALCGAVLAWVPVLAWLRSHGALDPFLDIAWHYWPLYDAITQRPYRTIEGLPRLMYLLEAYASGLAGRRLPWVAAAIGGAWVWRATDSDGRRPAVVPFVVFLVVTLLFPGITGKFWDYHWLPFGYAAVLLASVAWATPMPHDAGTARVAAVVMVLAVAGLPTRAWVGDARRTDELRQTDALVESVQRALQPGDTVQPLDWTRRGAARDAPHPRSAGDAVHGGRAPASPRGSSLHRATARHLAGRVASRPSAVRDRGRGARVGRGAIGTCALSCPRAPARVRVRGQGAEERRHPLRTGGPRDLSGRGIVRRPRPRDESSGRRRGRRR